MKNVIQELLVDVAFVAFFCLVVYGVGCGKSQQEEFPQKMVVTEEQKPGFDSSGFGIEPLELEPEADPVWPLYCPDGRTLDGHGYPAIPVYMATGDF